jgi:hypothetical protein
MERIQSLIIFLRLRRKMEEISKWEQPPLGIHRGVFPQERGKHHTKRRTKVGMNRIRIRIVWYHARQIRIVLKMEKARFLNLLVQPGKAILRK